MRGRPSAIIVVALLLASTPALGATSPPVRGWLEVGPSFDRKDASDHAGSGLGLGAGIELGRRWGLVASVGYERYSGHVGPTLQPIGGQTAIVEGDTDAFAWTGGLALRWSVPVGPVEANLEVGIGGYTLFRNSPVYSDAGTGAVIFTAQTRSSSAPMGEFGFTVRTHRGRWLDGYLGLRSRGYSQVGEAGFSGSTVQLRIGVLSR